MHDSETLTAGAPVWKENSLRNANTTQNQVSATAANSPRRLTGGRTPRRRPRGHSPVHPALQVVSRLVSAQSIFKATVPEALQEPLFEVLALAWNGKGGILTLNLGDGCGGPDCPLPVHICGLSLKTNQSLWSK